MAIGVTVARLLDEPRSETDQALCPPPLAACEVDRDRPEPGLWIVGVEQPRGMVQPTHERLLDHVLGLRDAAGHGDELPEQAPVRRGVQLLDLDGAHAAPPSLRRTTHERVRSVASCRNFLPSTADRGPQGGRDPRPVALEAHLWRPWVVGGDAVTPDAAAGLRRTGPEALPT